MQVSQPLGTLLGRFAERTGAATACVIGRDVDGGAVQWAHHDRARSEAAGFMEACCLVASEVMQHGRVHYEQHRAVPPAELLAVPIDVRDHAAGALCAGFDEELGQRAPAVMWSAHAYASAMGLCIDEPSGFGRLVGSARIDELTGCLTPSGLWETMAEEINRARRLQEPLSCAFIDLDGFKAVNDGDGHLNGDAVLAAIGGALRAGLRGYDSIGRFGGDEFVLVLPGADYLRARKLTERMLDGIGDVASPITRVKVTASSGVAEWCPGLSAEQWVDRADRMMLAAKSARRLRLVVPVGLVDPDSVGSVIVDARRGVAGADG
jgi:diguanylate cyclase (GGDEF)-like protein